MVKPRKADVEYRPIRLKIETYKRLEKRLFHYMQKADSRLTFDEALNLLMDDLDKLDRELAEVWDMYQALREKVKGK
jgi:hypothetical protein